MKHFIIVIFLTLPFCFYAQPGMYTESDIEFQTLFIEAQIAKMKGDSDTQITKLREVIKRNKTAHAAYYELAQAYLQKDNSELSEKNIKLAISHNTDNEWYQLFLANLYDKLEKKESAVIAYKRLLAINPDNPTVYHRLALNQLALGQSNEAAITLESLITRQGVDEETSRRIFDIYAKSDQESKAIATLEKLIASHPENTRYLNNLASYYIEIKKPEQAEKIFERIVKIDPNNSNAVLALAKKDVSKDEAASYLSSLMPIIENMNIPLENKIQELMPHLSTMTKDGPTVTSLNNISNKLVNLYPNRAEVYSLRADVLFYSSDFKGAKENYKKALNIDDRKYSLWYQYMLNLWELEESKILNTTASQAIDLFPNEVTAFLFQALGLSFSNPKEAKDYTREAKFIAGKNKILLNQISVVDQWLNKENATEKTFSNIDIKQLGDPIYLELLGDLYHSAKNTKMAHQLWRQAITQGSNEERINKKLIIE